MRRFVLSTLISFSLATGAGAQQTAETRQSQLDPIRITQDLGLGSAAPTPAAPAAKPAGTAPSLAEVAAVKPEPIRSFDYSSNLSSDVFGATLFSGSFARQGATQFNPDYLIAVGDRVQIRLWGGFAFDDALTVDPQGNLFLPHVGPVKVLGIANKDLQRTVESSVGKVFRANVFSYASLAAAQPVRIFVGGFVNRAGLYNGTSMDSLLHYLDQAGGIDPARGSFLQVQVKRGERVRATVNLYDFLLQGRIPLIQLADGDVIFVGPRNNTVLVSGLAQNPKRFEFASQNLGIANLVTLAKPKAEATHVRVVRNTGTVRNVEYFALADAGSVTIGNGDEVEFTSDKKPGTITVRVEGEHLSAQEYVLPYGARIGDLMTQIQYSERSDRQSLQLFRKSVRDRQKAMLGTALKSLESSVLTARSGTSDEARLRKEEAELILQWVERAKSIQPTGQVLIAQAPQIGDLTLENGDIVRVPARDNLVLVNGEVLFPNAVAFDQELKLEDYIRRAGGYSQNADTSRIVVAHRDGSFEEAETSSSLFGSDTLKANLQSGDEILVLPRIDVKSRQITKDLTQILYQMAISAKVIFGL